MHCSLLALAYFSELFHLNGRGGSASFSAYPVCHFNILMFSSVCQFLLCTACKRYYINVIYYVLHPCQHFMRET